MKRADGWLIYDAFTGESVMRCNTRREARAIVRESEGTARYERMDA